MSVLNATAAHPARHHGRNVERPLLDLPTFALFAVMMGGLAANAVLAARGWLPLPLATLIAVALLNCSFTVWHEAVHGTLSRLRTLNDTVGYLAAWVSMIPYFKMKAIHWLHHRFTNDPERDPDYPFITGPYWKMVLRYPSLFRRYAAVRVRSTLALVDAVGQFAVVAIFVGGWYGGFLSVLVAVWLVPKLIAMYIHGWYVNYLPHHGCEPGRFSSARVIPLRWLYPLVLFHNYHGLHHAFLTIPWHRYEQAFRENREYLEARGMPVGAVEGLQG